MLEKTKPGGRTAESTKAAIIRSAQLAFAQRGYSQTGLREIATCAGISDTLIVKYFKTKANLFEQALTEALIDPEFFQADRSSFGHLIVETVSDQEQPMIAPAMVALSLGDEQARDIIARVSNEHILRPMQSWLGAPRSGARAIAILMLTAGFAIYGRHLKLGETDAVRREAAELLAQSLQAIVDAGGDQG